MDFHSVIGMIGGLALFLYGMSVLSAALEKTAGGRTKSVLEKMTSNRLSGLLLGTVVTSVIQSSSAVTVMLVGLVNSGVMQLSQAISVTMGANIGTTVTAWLLSLTGIDSSNIFVSMLKPSNFSPVLAFIGAIMLMFAKKPKVKDIANVLIGFSVLMFGMSFMSDSVEGLTNNESFTGMLTLFSNPVMGVIVGTVFTAIIQSSSASVGVLQALSMTGAVTYGAAVPIIMGQNIGTCISAMIACIGTSKNAKRVALVHVLFNILGTVICLPLWLLATALLLPGFAELPVSPVSIAVSHSVFNIVTTAMMFPFTSLLEKAARRLIPDAKKAERDELLDDRLLTVPSVAAAKADAVACEMARTARDSVIAAFGLFESFSSSSAALVERGEQRLDELEDALGTYLIRLSNADVSDAEQSKIIGMLHSISDFERIGDHASELLEAARELKDKKISFSESAAKELGVVTAAVSEILGMTVKAFSENDAFLAKSVEPLEQVIDMLVSQMKSSHVKRLAEGECGAQAGFVLNDILNAVERVSDHCSNVAVAVIEAKLDRFDSHSYLSAVKSGADAHFVASFKEYSEKYAI